MRYTIPTRQEILSDFQKWCAKALQNPQSVKAQFQRLVRRWIKCGYSVAEIPLLVSCTTEQLQSAIAAAQVQA